MVGQGAKTQRELPTCEEIDTAAYAAKFCRPQTILPHYPDRGKRNKQAEHAVRLSMSDSEGESLVGRCLIICVQGAQGRRSRVEVWRVQSMAEPRGVEGVTTSCMHATSTQLSKPFAMWQMPAAQPNFCGATDETRGEVADCAKPSDFWQAVDQFGLK